jgi:hypothetical protein
MDEGTVQVDVRYDGLCVYTDAPDIRNEALLSTHWYQTKAHMFNFCVHVLITAIQQSQISKLKLRHTSVSVSMGSQRTPSSAVDAASWARHAVRATAKSTPSSGNRNRRRATGRDILLITMIALKDLVHKLFNQTEEGSEGLR